jgi:hypothetical protein
MVVMVVTVARAGLDRKDLVMRETLLVAVAPVVGIRMVGALVLQGIRAKAVVVVEEEEIRAVLTALVETEVVLAVVAVVQVMGLQEAQVAVLPAVAVVAVVPTARAQMATTGETAVWS